VSCHGPYTFDYKTSNIFLYLIRYTVYKHSILGANQQGVQLIEQSNCEYRSAGSSSQNCLALFIRHCLHYKRRDSMTANDFSSNSPAHSRQSIDSGFLTRCRLCR